MDNEMSRRPVSGIDIDDEQIKAIFATRKYSPQYFRKVADRIKSYVSEDGNDDIIDTMMDYNHFITKNRKMSIPKYVDAIRFCQLSLNNSEAYAWRMVFPERYEALIELYPDPVIRHDMAGRRAAAYAAGKLVSAIKTDMLIPTHIMYSGVRKKGVQCLVDILQGKAAISYMPKYMRDDKGKLILDKHGQRQFLYIGDTQQFEEIHQVVAPKVQADAAKTIIEITTAPETLKIEGNIHHTADTSVMKQNVMVMDEMRKFAEEQRAAALSGADINELQKVAHIIDVDVDEEEEEEE